MKKMSLGEKLEALAQGEERSQIGRLRGVLDQVERALGAGVPRKKILETLHEEGFTFTLRSFDSALRNLRREREKKGVTSPKENPSPTQAVRTSLPPVPSPPPSVGGSSSVPVEPIILEMREELRVFKDSIKHLPDRERRQKLSDFQEKQDERLKIHRMVNKTK